MLICQLFFRKNQHLYSCRGWASILLLLVFCSSCSPPAAPNVDLKISDVKPAGRPGVYSLAGSTNLPDQSQIAVAALRYLRPADQQSLNPDPNATYSILARQIVKVEQGKWQTSLNLWQVAPDGRYQEGWQLNQSQIGVSLTPANSITFLATFEPAAQNQTPEQQTGEPRLRGGLVRFTSEGQQYVRATQTVPIALPAGKTTPPKLRAEDINGGWGDRSELKPEPVKSGIVRSRPLVKTSQTNAPLSPSEFLR